MYNKLYASGFWKAEEGQKCRNRERGVKACLSIRNLRKTGSIAYLCDEYLKNNFIDPEASERLGGQARPAEPGWHRRSGGLTNVCDVVGYDLVDGKRVPTDGRLIYRGIDVEQIVRAAYAEDRFVFEEVIWLLLFGSLPTPHQLASFKQVLEAHRELPKDFAEDMIMKAPSPNIMNKMARSVLALYSYDDNPEEQSLTNILSQSIALIASLPTIMVNAYQIKRRVYDRQSMYLHLPQPGQSTAEHILPHTGRTRSSPRKKQSCWIFALCCMQTTAAATTRPLPAVCCPVPVRIPIRPSRRPSAA